MIACFIRDEVENILETLIAVKGVIMGPNDIPVKRQKKTEGLGLNLGIGCGEFLEELLPGRNDALLSGTVQLRKIGLELFEGSIRPNLRLTR